MCLPSRSARLHRLLAERLLVLGVVRGTWGKKYNVSIGKDPQSMSVLQALLKNEKLNSCLLAFSLYFHFFKTWRGGGCVNFSCLIHYSFLMWVRVAVFTRLCLLTPPLLLECLPHKRSLINRARKVTHRADDAEHGFPPARKVSGVVSLPSLLSVI